MATTARERASEQKILAAASTMLAQLGESGLQMKPLADRAGVAIATLYRYFPSKDHVLAGLALERYQTAFARSANRSLAGETPGERAYELLLREFRAAQREPELVAALVRAVNSPDRAISEYAEQLQRLLTGVVHAAAAQGIDGLTADQERVLPLVVSVYNGALVNWLGGITSAEEVRLRVRTASRLLDLAPDVLGALLED